MRAPFLTLLKPELLAVVRDALDITPHIHVTLALDLDLLLADRSGSLFRFMHFPLADGNLLLDDWLLGHLHPLFLDRDADLLARPDVAGGGPPGGRVTLDNDFLTGHGNVDRLLLGVNLL